MLLRNMTGKEKKEHIKEISVQQTGIKTENITTRCYVKAKTRQHDRQDGFPLFKSSKL